MNHGKLISFPSDHEEEIFHRFVTSCGKPRCDMVSKVVDACIVFFLNASLAMHSITAYNETNMNRLLIGYDPTAKDLVDSKGFVYPVLDRFKNSYWAKSHLIKWSLFPRFLAILDRRTPLKIVSTADVIACVIFLAMTGQIEINPVCCVNVTTGNPFFVKELISRYWFMKGIRVQNVYEFKFHQIDRYEKRKRKYLRKYSNKALMKFYQGEETL